jgi:hypothetical protein
VVGLVVVGGGGFFFFFFFFLGWGGGEEGLPICFGAGFLKYNRNPATLVIY